MDEDEILKNIKDILNTPMSEDRIKTDWLTQLDLSHFYTRTTLGIIASGIYAMKEKYGVMLSSKRIVEISDILLERINMETKYLLPEDCTNSAETIQLVFQQMVLATILVTLLKQYLLPASIDEIKILLNIKD